MTKKDSSGSSSRGYTKILESESSDASSVQDPISKDSTSKNDNKGTDSILDDSSTTIQKTRPLAKTARTKRQSATNVKEPAKGNSMDDLLQNESSEPTIPVGQRSSRRLTANVDNIILSGKGVSTPQRPSMFLNRTKNIDALLPDPEISEISWSASSTHSAHKSREDKQSPSKKSKLSSESKRKSRAANKTSDESNHEAPPAQQQIDDDVPSSSDEEIFEKSTKQKETQASRDEEISTDESKGSERSKKSQSFASSKKSAGKSKDALSDDESIFTRQKNTDESASILESQPNEESLVDLRKSANRTETLVTSRATRSSSKKLALPSSVESAEDEQHLSRRSNHLDTSVRSTSSSQRKLTVPPTDERDKEELNLTRQSQQQLDTSVRSRSTRSTRSASKKLTQPPADEQEEEELNLTERSNQLDTSVRSRTSVAVDRTNTPSKTSKDKTKSVRGSTAVIEEAFNNDSEESEELSDENKTKSAAQKMSRSKIDETDKDLSKKSDLTNTEEHIPGEETNFEAITSIPDETEGTNLNSSRDSQGSKRKLESDESEDGEGESQAVNVESTNISQGSKRDMESDESSEEAEEEESEVANKDSTRTSRGSKRRIESDESEEAQEESEGENEDSVRKSQGAGGRMESIESEGENEETNLPSRLTYTVDVSGKRSIGSKSQRLNSSGVQNVTMASGEQVSTENHINLDATKQAQLKKMMQRTLSSSRDKVDERLLDPEFMNKVRLDAIERVRKENEANRAKVSSKLKAQTASIFKRPLAPVKNKNQPEKKKKPIDKAFYVNGKVYKPPPLPRPKSWATDKLYNQLKKRMEPKFGLETRLQSEKFVTYLSECQKIIEKEKKYNKYKLRLKKLMKKMAQLRIINNRKEFYYFCQEYMPHSFCDKVIPMVKAGNISTVPLKVDKLERPLIDSDSDTD